MNHSTINSSARLPLTQPVPQQSETYRLLSQGLSTTLQTEQIGADVLNSLEQQRGLLESSNRNLGTIRSASAAAQVQIIEQ